MPKVRKSMSATPRAGDFDLLQTVRTRAHKLFKASIATITKLDEDDELNALIV